MVSQNDPSQTRAPSVVVLSTDEMVRDAVAYWFKALSIQTVATADGYEANRAIKEGGVRLLITDRILPPWPGLDTFRQLRTANPTLRVAYVDDGSWDGAILARVAGSGVILPRPLVRQQVIEAFGRPES